MLISGHLLVASASASGVLAINMYVFIDNVHNKVDNHKEKKQPGEYNVHQEISARFKR